MYESKLLSKAKWFLIPLMLLLMAISMIGFITPAKAAENTDLRDQVTENYIKEHVDGKYTTADKTELKNLITVKQTLFDGSKTASNETLDSIMSNANANFDKMLGQFIVNVPVYNLSDNSEYYVAYVNTMKNNNQAIVRDYVFAKNNDLGEVLDNCVYDSATGLAYIPKSYFAKDGKNVLDAVQIQLMQVMNKADDISLKTCSAVENENNEVKTTETTYSGLYDDTVSVQTEKGLNKDDFVVYSNGRLLESTEYNYDADSGKVTVKGSPVLNGQITVEKINNTEKAEVKDMNLKTQYLDLSQMTHNIIETPISIPKSTKVGDVIDGTTTMQYTTHWEKYMTEEEVAQRKQDILNGVYKKTYSSEGGGYAPITPGSSQEISVYRARMISWIDHNKTFVDDDPGSGWFYEEADTLYCGGFTAILDDGKANFSYKSSGRSFDASQLTKVLLYCTHVAENSDMASEYVKELNNGNVIDAPTDPAQYGYIVNDMPVRMRFYEIGEDYAVIGMLASRAQVVSDNQDQAAYGVFKVPIQKENLKLRIEKDDESGAKLAGADMELYKDKVEGDPYAFWNTSEDDGNPKDFENIEAGKYILVEENAPEGYTKVEPIEFTLNDDGTVQITKDPSGKATVEMNDGVATIKVADPKELKPTGDKTETNPGDGQDVKHGQEITYEITTTNKYTRNADVVITDPLDKGLDFVTADNGGHYDENTRTITWTFNNVEPNETKKVTFKAKVNDTAEIKVVNDAKIVYDNDYQITTRKVENPIPEPPVKTEPTPGENQTVKVGDNVTYEVAQKNYKDAPATIVITDHLDSCVDFVTADNNGSYDANTHTITWTLTNVPSGETAKVGFTVKVNDKAVELIENQAIAKVGNDSEQETNIIKNPLPEPPLKAEPTPGENQTVKVGDEVKYEVTQRNYRLEAADVVITDHLDKGVDFVSADNDGKYDKDTHTITWTLKNVPSRDIAKVSFTVKVNDKASQIIENKAITKVGNDAEQETNIIKNPLPEPPVKAEPKPGENQTVNVGDEVSYEVTQKNYKFEAADIVITDHLDKAVDFVTADNNGVYDKDTHTIIWTIKNVPSGETAKVGFIVKVNDKAVEIIENQAITKVGNDAEQETNIIKNPLPEPPVKTEPKPGENEPVAVGEEITYEVAQKNYKLEATDIVITDHLDERVDFVSADNDGSYDANTHTI
ncbi:MAG: DUF11 domain-containing protein, partial [Eubacteriaceae bacterium]|nr:DUF11 domain-containing protein [Eubacteriaceae bacterium]